ncbi:hypothetical protein [Deinococcus sp. 6GRE01]|uniref:hypothetical protein n=1 Tax=Deinococcus sp. 6GRE01 TaxID=2745873 RepID=UPI001E52C9FD|nr:hypothetical protein [Deinococcus sp. 6GRE01]MCD0156270.1 hypothetical protein [Deinococcus sp. 6GRE01]
MSGARVPNGCAWVPRPGTAAHRILARATEIPAPSEQLAPRQPANVRSVTLSRLVRAGYLTHPSRDRYAITPAGQSVLQCSAAGLTARAAQVLLIVTDAPQALTSLTIRIGLEHAPMCHSQLHVTLQALADRDLVVHENHAYRLTPSGTALQEAARARLTFPHATRATASAHARHAALVECRARRLQPRLVATACPARARRTPLKRRILAVLTEEPLPAGELLAALRLDGLPSPTINSVLTTLARLRLDGLAATTRTPDRRAQLWSLA